MEHSWDLLFQLMEPTLYYMLPLYFCSVQIIKKQPQNISGIHVALFELFFPHTMQQYAGHGFAPGSLVYIK